MEQDTGDLRAARAEAADPDTEALLPGVTGACAGAFAELVGSRAEVEGVTEARFPGVRFYRVSRPATFRKTLYLGPTLTIVAQGRKVARFGSLELSYDPCRALVVTGEASCEGAIIEASHERPYLAVCLAIPSDLVAKTLLALADANAPAAEETAPAFVSVLDGAIKEGVVRLLHAIDDPIERQIVAPLVLEEIVFRLLRSDAAAVVRRAVGRDRDDESIQEAMRYMRANADGALSVELIARHVAMSPSHFAHRFRAVARVSPMRYLKQIRMHEARALLLAPGLRVGEVVARVGYESASHFARDFKSYFGAPPGEFVRRFRPSP